VSEIQLEAFLGDYMRKKADEALGEVLKQVHSHLMAYKYTDKFQIDEFTDAERFIDNSIWALSFGGLFKDELMVIADQVIGESDDKDWGEDRG